MKPTARNHKFRGQILHWTRFLLFAGVIALIHFQYRGLNGSSQSDFGRSDVSPKDIQRLFPEANEIQGSSSKEGNSDVLKDGRLLGYLLSTSPQCDDLIGFSGPTHTLIALDPSECIVGLHVHASGDTKDHVAHVVKNREFMTAFNGLSSAEIENIGRVDAVSGATLTSMTIAESVIRRLGGQQKSMRFPEPVTAEEVEELFSLANQVEDSDDSRISRVLDGEKRLLGFVTRSTPVADDIVGYQGPSDTIVGYDEDGKVTGIVLRNSFDNQPYVRYVQEDSYFHGLFVDKTLDELAQSSLEDLGVEGVSGATMTSLAVAEGVIATAKDVLVQQATDDRQASMSLPWAARDVGTLLVLISGVLIAFSHLRGRKSVRLIFQIIVIAYLGFINGDMISQAMIVGWAQNGIPWQRAGGLVVLTATAFMIPLVSKRNVYCTHLCPHGAAQQLLRNGFPVQIRFSGNAKKILRILPYLLLVWCVLVAMLALPFSLVDIEPFDAWVWYVAGWPTIIIALVGLIASTLEPMAYCRFGCPTGALLGFLRFDSRREVWTTRDWLSVMLFVIAVILFLFS